MNEPVRFNEKQILLYFSSTQSIICEFCVDEKYKRVNFSIELNRFLRVHSVSSVRKQYDRSRTVSRSVFVLFVVLIEKYECLKFTVQTVRSYCLHVSRTVCYFYNDFSGIFKESRNFVVKIANSTTNVQTVQAYCLHDKSQTLVLFNLYDKQYENRTRNSTRLVVLLFAY